MKLTNSEELVDYLHRFAETFRRLLPGLAEDCHEVAKLIPDIPWRLIPLEHYCEECGGQMKVADKFCPQSKDYKIGFRAIWKCPACGEYEVR